MPIQQTAGGAGVPFTVADIEQAHQQVKTGADFPMYIQTLKHMGVSGFETFVVDSHTVYHGANGYQTASAPKYAPLAIAVEQDAARFRHYLKVHQQGETDYPAFCRHCAETGVDKWVVSLDAMTCTYYDIRGGEVLVEAIPG